jgi:superfamily II DNA or RNA helicase
MQELKDKYADKIYRPGEDDVDDLSAEEMSERREEIAQMFASGKTDFDGNVSNGE